MQRVRVTEVPDDGVFDAIVELTFGSSTDWNVNTTSLAANGEPSENVTPGRSVAVQVSPSGDTVGTCSARAGTSARFASRDTSPSKIFDAPSGANPRIGLRLSGSEPAPMTIDRPSNDVAGPLGAEQAPTSASNVTNRINRRHRIPTR